ncbi:hypothetical protein CsatA_018002 [Cannabis sativa]
MYVRQCDEGEASLNKDAEMKTMHDAEEIEKLEIALTGNLQQYQQFTWEEIQSATCNFSEVLIIGFGGYGTAFKCKFHQTTAAVKVLSSNESCKDEQFLCQDQLEPNEYQRTGLISPKSDVYSLGIVILQLLTAKPALALAHVVETAVREGHLEDIFDSNAGNWPSKETKEMVELGLRCVELFRKDRPDLQA